MDDLERKVRLAEIPKLIDLEEAGIAEVTAQIAALERKRSAAMYRVVDLGREAAALRREPAQL